MLYDKDQRYTGFAMPFVLRTALLFLIALLSLIVTGCRYTSAPADLLQKPSISKEQQEIIAALQKAMPKYSVLMLPFRDDSKEAIRLIDVNGDGEEEAVVTYYNEFNIPELLILKKSGDSWKPWVVIEQPTARGMEWLKFVDLNNDGHLELLVGWVGSFESPNTLELYSFQTKGERNQKGSMSIKPIEAIPYSYAETGMLGDNGETMLAVVTEQGSKQLEESSSYQLVLYEWKGGTIRPKARLALNNTVNNYDHMLIGNISEQQKGIVVEGSYGAHGTYTTMLLWDGSTLDIIYPNERLGQDGISLTTVFSEDFNGDGIVELQIKKETPDSKGLPYSDTSFTTYWQQWNGKHFVTKGEQLLDYSYGYKLDIPDSWRGRYTWEYGSNEYEAAVFYYWNEQSEQKSELATLYAIPQKIWSTHDQEWKEEGRNYRTVMIDSGNVYAISFVSSIPPQLQQIDRQIVEEMLKVEINFSSYISALD